MAAVYITESWMHNIHNKRDGDVAHVWMDAETSLSGSLFLLLLCCCVRSASCPLLQPSLNFIFRPLSLNAPRHNTFCYALLYKSIAQQYNI